ncbi:hypothetical protein ACP4OV_002468 [Aristida adscensionis]
MSSASQTTEAQDSNNLPWLVVDPDGATKEGRTTLVDSKGECHTRVIDALGSDMRYALTWQGWILSLNPAGRQTFLSDPRTSDKIELPHLEQQLPRTFQCALSDKPTNDGCVVVVLHPDKPTFWYCHVGGSEWIKHDYDVGKQQYDVKGLVWKEIVIHHLTSCEGRFHFDTSHIKHGILEFSPHPVIRLLEMRGIPDVVPPNPWGFAASACCFELDGRIYRLFAYYIDNRSVITSIALYKMDMVRKRWCEVDEIGDQALLWSGYGGRCCSASEFGLEPNCAYWINSSDKLLHIFDILKKTERVCVPPKDIPKLSSKAFWLLPNPTD